jgi:hypothetical protein
MAQPQLCLIIPLGPAEGGGGVPTPPIFLPPTVWPPTPPGGGGVPTPPIYYPPTSPEYPAHPIAPGGPPPGIWPSPGYPTHPIAPGGPPPGIWPSPGHPAHPIAPGGQPPIATHPIVIPPSVWPPEPPAGLPPGAVWPPLGVVVWVPGYGWATFPISGTPPEVTPST